MYAIVVVIIVIFLTTLVVIIGHAIKAHYDRKKSLGETPTITNLLQHNHTITSEYVYLQDISLISMVLKIHSQLF